MDEVITRAINSIDQLLKILPSIYSKDKPKLIGIRDLLNQLFESNSQRNKWTHSFCWQLNRLMNYNERLSKDFWIDLHDDIVYVLEGPNGAQGIGTNWARFLKRIRLEDERMQRELKYRQTFRGRKTLNQLFCEHQKVIEEYLQKCISLHSKMQVRGVIENLDDFLHKECGPIETPLIRQNQTQLEEKLKCIDITLDCSNRSLTKIDHYSTTYVDPWSSTTKQSLSNFLPSIETRPTDTDQRTAIKKILESDRWVVILGDPGSAKSTLLRWITRVFAETVHLGKEEVTLKGFYDGAVRVPILIRIGEFAACLDQHQNKTLIDYIGKHTWLSQSYTDDDNGSVLKELIDHGHALILLDGLDEIPEVGRRGEIVDLVRKFIDEYVRAPDFYSAFGEAMSSRSSYYQSVIEIQPPCRSGDNQIIMTSRFVGYQFYPILGPFIDHYSLSLMDHKEAQEFINRWMIQVEKCIHDVLLSEGIKLDEEKMKSLSTRRHNAVKSMFKNVSELLKSNPSLLSLICTLIFQSSKNFHPKCRVEVYDRAVQSALSSWSNQEPSVSEDFFTTFLINLSSYLYLNSPSGLIDTYDMKQLCSLILRQENVSNNHVELRKYANKMTLILESNMCIVSEVGLEVFGFQHLSFQEYFVSQSFVQGSSIEAVAKRILTFIINPRFRESLIMAFGWISWKWPFDDYDTFCNLLVTYDKNYDIPLGILLFLDALTDLQRLPSKSIIFNALNSLFDYPFNILAEMYLIRNLSKLPEKIIVEWMQLRLKDEKCLLKFCQCLLTSFHPDWFRYDPNTKSILLVIYQHLRSFHDISTTADFVVDQTLRRIMMSEYAPDNVSTGELSLYLQSHNMSASCIHPLILSVIVAVYGGMYFKWEKGKDTMELCFSSKHMHRQSSIASFIIKYLVNHQESHSIKVELLINQYENIIERSSPTDTSIDIVDTFIALICLKGLSKLFFYEKYHGYQALLLAINRLKQICFYSKWLSSNSNDSPYFLTDKSSVISDVKSMMNMLFSQSAQFNDERLTFSLVCAGALSKLNIDCSPLLSTLNPFLPDNISRYLEYQPEFSHFDNEKKLDRMVKKIHCMQMFQHEPYFLLTFIPQSLQNLYYYMIINPINKNDSLPLVVLLSQCLILLQDVDKNDPNFYLALSILKSQFKEHMLENYVSVLLWENCFIYDHQNRKRKELFESMKNHVIFDELFTEQSKDWEMLINVERQRISDLRYAQQNHDKDLRLFAASISLARLFQARYRSPNTRTIEQINLSTTESEEVHLAIINIHDRVLRIIVWSIILDMKDPLIFELQWRDQLRWEMIDLLQSLLPDLPLLTATLLFVRCHSIRQLFPVLFQQMTDIIADKLNEKSNDKHSRSQEAAFIALKQLNNPELSRFLFKFSKQKENLSDLSQFNSSIFFRCFTHTTSFDSSHNILLSLMYLTELAFDAQILQMYKNDSQQSRIPLLSELDQLWNDSSENKKIMTFKVATWITNYLQMSDKEKLQEMIEDVSKCVMIESKILPVIKEMA